MLINPNEYFLHRDYIVLVKGKPRYDKASVRGFIMKDPNNLKRWRIVKQKSSSSKAQWVSSTYRVLCQQGEEGKDLVSAVSVRIMQGRTHQVRATCTFLKCPIIGDTLYSQASMKEESTTEEEGQNSFIHASRLSFVDSRRGGSYLYDVRAPLPIHWSEDYPQLAAQIPVALGRIEEERLEKKRRKILAREVVGDESVESL